MRSNNSVNAVKAVEAGNTARRLLGLLLVPIVLASAAMAKDNNADHKKAIKLVAQIQRADYEGDRAALQRLYTELQPVAGDKVFAARVRYWRGFALWRKVLNSFNDSSDWSSQEPDLNLAIAEFTEASKLDPEFVDAKIAAASCLSNLMFLNQKDPERLKELLSQEIPLVKEAQVAAPENPRLLWVVGANRWNIPPERGGGQQAALDTYQKGLESARKHHAAGGDPLEPTWGEPELLMNLGWANLNRATPDLAAAEQNARAALQLVPYWHYVRDILLPQVLAAKKNAAGEAKQR